MKKDTKKFMLKVKMMDNLIVNRDMGAIPEEVYISRSLSTNNGKYYYLNK